MYLRITKFCFIRKYAAEINICIRLAYKIKIRRQSFIYKHLSVFNLNKNNFSICAFGY